MCHAVRTAALVVGVLIASLAIPGSAGAGNRCLAGKTKCTAKKAAGLLNCYAKAQKAGGAVDPTCLGKVQRKFDGGSDPSRGCFAKLEAKNDGPCLTTGDTASMEARVDAFVGAAIAALEPAPTASPTPHPPTATATPTVHATAGPVDNQRCTGNTRTTCTSNADCSGAGGTCEYWLGGTVALSAGGVASCLTNQFNGSITGTFDTDTGAGTGAWPVISRVYAGPTQSQPCPLCQGDTAANDGLRDGTCFGGANNGLTCDTNGSSVQFGATSLDCPPLGSAQVGALSVDLSNTTGNVSLTLSSASPDCRAPGFTSDKCACDTCNNAAAEPCATNADCPDPPGPIGPICGGKRCRGGSNDGAACTSVSECTGGACGVPGFATAPNQCDDFTCSPDGGNEGVCSGGPTEQFCGPGETFRSCVSNADCPRPGDTCAITKLRDCFRDNGIIGNSITGTGVAGVPSGHQSDGTLVSVHCVGPTFSAAVNASTGLPGPERLELPVRITDDGGASCPTTLGFFASPGSQGVLDRGWTGIAHDSLFPTDAVVTFAVTGCAGSPPNCGACSYSGPIPNP